MKRARALLPGILTLAGCAGTPPEVAIINDAADAVGGRDRILAVNSLVVEGAGENINIGQNTAPGAPGPTYKVSEYKRSVDFVNDRGRVEMVRTPTFVFINMMPQRQVQGLDGDVAFNVAADGMATRASELVKRERRAELFHHPIGALRAALSEGARISNVRQNGGNDVVDVTTGEGDTLTLYVDGSTKRPMRVDTAGYNNVLGDVIVSTSFEDYSTTDGMQVPTRLRTRLDDFNAADIQVSKTTINGDVSGLAAPENVKAAAAPTPTANVVVQDLARGVWLLGGQSHNSVLVERADHLVLIEAPQNEVRTAAVLAKVKEIKPDKPLRYVVVTHHHFDHTGGVRRAIAEGAALVVHEGARSFFEDLALRKHTVVPDELTKNPKPPSVEAVSDKRVLSADSRTIEVYTVQGNPHGDTLLMVYLPAERLLVQGDLYNPPPQPNAAPVPWAFAPNFLENIQKRNLRVDRIVPIHGPVIPFSHLLAAVKLTRAQSS